MGESTDDGSAALVCHGCGKRHDSARLMQLPDGRLVGNHSEEWRMYTEAKWAMALPDRVGPRSKKLTKARYLLEVQNARGERAAAELRAVMVKLWQEAKRVP